MQLKPIIVVNINYSQSILSKNYYYNPKNSLLFVYQHFQKSHNEMSHPVVDCSSIGTASSSVYLKKHKKKTSERMYSGL